MRRNGSTVVILVGSPPPGILAVLTRSMNVTLIRPDDPADRTTADRTAASAPAAAEALRRAARVTSPYALVAADPLAPVAAAWRAMWDVSRQPGPAAFEQEAANAVIAWRQGAFELPDYYLVLAHDAAKAAQTAKAPQTAKTADAAKPAPGEPADSGPEPDFHLGPLRASRPHRVVFVPAAEPAEQAAGLLHALGSLRHGPWWPPLDDIMETARTFYPGRLAESPA